MNFFKTKPQVKSMNINYVDLFNTVIENRNENYEYENIESDFNTYDDFMLPNHYVAVKNNDVILR